MINETLPNADNKPAMYTWAERLANLPFFLAVQRSLAVTLPLIMIGALALLVRDFPLQSVQNAMDRVLDPNWRQVCDNLVAGSFGITALVVLCAFSSIMTTLANQRDPLSTVSPIMAAIVSLSCFFIVGAPAETGSWPVLFSLGQGLLIALAVAIASTLLYLRLSRIPALRLSLGAAGHDPTISDVLTVLPAGMVTMCIFALIRVLFLPRGANLHDQLHHLLALPSFSGAWDHLATGLVYTAFSQLSWFFGLHGPNILFSVEEDILAPAGMANAAAFANGLPPAHIFTKAFFDAFTNMGGAGCTLCLILAVFLCGKDAGNRKLCLFALVPGLFNVNEPLLFGLPLVFNPVYLIPFLLVPLIQTIAAYLATAFDLLPRTIATASWTTPALLSGFIATGSLTGTCMQLINLALGTAIYIPFVRIGDRLLEDRGQHLLAVLLRAAESRTTGPQGRRCLDLPGDAGRLAKLLAEDLKGVLDRDDQLFIVYQPQVEAISNRIRGVEALLRWRHPVFGFIPPPLIIALAEDTDGIGWLGRFVLREACNQRAAWKGLVADDLVMSINVIPRQILAPYFDLDLIAALQDAGVPPSQLEVEITESTMFEPDAASLDMLGRLRLSGVQVAIDDFGMGHTSLRYLREFPIDTVKLDRSLTQVGNGDVNESIVLSIVELSRALGFRTVVEGIENLEQLDYFLRIGCHLFQGYLFCRPVSGEDCLHYIRLHSGGSAAPSSHFPARKQPRH